MKKKLITIEKQDKNHKLKKILVNSITGLRALGSLAIIPIFKACGSIPAALAATGFFLTDFIDGQLARRLHVQSFFGSLLDSLSDKAFGIICLVLLALENPIYWTILAGEVAIVYANYKSAQKGNNIQSSFAGKAKTCLLGATIVGSFFCLDAPSLKNILEFINIKSLDKALSLEPQLLTTLMAIPTIAAEGYVLYDYVKRANDQTEAKKAKEIQPTECAIQTSGDIEASIAEIEQKKQELTQEKEKIKELKSRKEIIHDLFDTEFYLEHKDDEIKTLLYK